MTAALMLVVPAILTQTTTAQNRGGAGAAPRASDTDTRPYDRRDFSGLWSHGPQTYGLPACPECNAESPIPVPGYGFFGDVPPRTPAGEQTLLMRKHGRGFEPDDPRLAKYPNLDLAYRRAVLPTFGNDPEARCEPLGLPRLLAIRGGGSTMEMVHTRANDRIIQRFEWFWDNREIWVDGRALPNVEDYLPRYMGYSVGRWEGNTLVVTSTGFDDRQWLDMFGFPISEKAVLVERWERPSPNRLRLQMTLTDPVNYTRPWPAAFQVWALIPKDRMSIGGWSGILEDRCVPSDEALFNTFRDHAAGVK